MPKESCPCCGRLLTAKTILEHMNRRRPALLAGNILNQNSWLHNDSRNMPMSQEMARKELFGPRRMHKKTTTTENSSFAVRCPASPQRNHTTPTSQLSAKQQLLGPPRRTKAIPHNSSASSSKSCPPPTQEPMETDRDAGNDSREAPTFTFEDMASDFTPEPADGNGPSPVDTGTFSLEDMPSNTTPEPSPDEPADLEHRLRSALNARYSRPKSIVEDYISDDEDDEEGDDEEEDDIDHMEHPFTALFDPDEDDTDDESDNGADEEDSLFPGGRVPTLWDFPEEQFLKKVAELDGNLIDDSVLNMLRAYKFKVESSLTGRDFQKMRHVIPKADLASLKSIETQVKRLSDIKSTRYDCCPLSCICYTGNYKDKDKCPKCNTPRYQDDGRSPRAYFEYFPIIPRLRALVASPCFASKMQYRASYEQSPGVMADIYDGSHYQTLKKTPISVRSTVLPDFFFSDSRDIALGLSTDGFGPFKRRNKTAWPVILFNYNLPPTERFQTKNLIPVGVIPGPKKPSDMDSFLWPLIQELVQLEIGIKAFDAVQRVVFLLRAFLVLVFGDIPAISMLMRIKGQNGVQPCRMCEIQAIRPPNSKTLYVPLSRKKFNPMPTPQEYKASELPLRNHSTFMHQAREVQSASTMAEVERLATSYGIKGVPLLSTLRSLSFPSSFPYDFMHLIWANLIPNLILLWTGTFKDIDHSCEGYVLHKTVWEAIAAAGANAGAYIPSAFGSRVPNLVTEKKHLTCEAYANWTRYLAPVLLRGRFLQEKYYKHFVRLVKLLNTCLELEITHEEIDEIEKGFQDWVQDYEKLYYRNEPERVSACPLTIHALLHIAPSIRVAGPVWAYWAFPMERYCGSIHVGSCRRPYISINNYLSSAIHLSQIEVRLGIHEQLSLSSPQPPNPRQLSHPSYPGFILTVSREPAALPIPLYNNLIATLATRFEVDTNVLRLILPQRTKLTQYARARLLDGGDVIHARELIKLAPDHRDMSFVRYQLEVDRHSHIRRRRPEFELRDFFGRVLRFLVVDVPGAPMHSIMPTSMVFAVVRQLKVTRQIQQPLRLCYFKDDSGPVEMVDLNQIECLVGRIHDRNEWAVVERNISSAPVHT